MDCRNIESHSVCNKCVGMYVCGVFSWKILFVVDHKAVPFMLLESGRFVLCSAEGNFVVMPLYSRYPLCLVVGSSH